MSASLPRRNGSNGFATLDNEPKAAWLGDKLIGGANQFLNRLEGGLGSSRRDRLIIARSFNCG